MLTDQHVTPLANVFVRRADGIVSIEAALIQTCLPMVRQVLEQQKTATGEFDYDDLISGVARALDRPGGKELVCVLWSRYHVALVDEFQDTDNDQWMFFHRVFVESNDGNRVYVIGDPKQAIYGFRGADVITYQAALAPYYCQPRNAWQFLFLENYRSTAELIDACNYIFDQSEHATFFTGAIQYEVPVAAGKEWILEDMEGSSAVPVKLLKIEPKGRKLESGELGRGLARRIAREVHELLSSPDDALKFGLRDGDLRPIGPNDIFILTAKNSEALDVGHALRSRRTCSVRFLQAGWIVSNRRS